MLSPGWELVPGLGQRPGVVHRHHVPLPSREVQQRNQTATFGEGGTCAERVVSNVGNVGHNSWEELTLIMYPG